MASRIPGSYFPVLLLTLTIEQRGHGPVNLKSIVFSCDDDDVVVVVVVVAVVAVAVVAVGVAVDFMRIEVQ